MPKPETNSRIFAVLMIVTEIIFAVMHGVYIRPVYQAGITLSLQGFWQPFLMALVAILGFGLIFSYNKRLLWSGLGFTFFITAFVLQFYPLINAFWTKTTLIGDSVLGITTPRFDDDGKTYPVFLSRESDPGIYENHIESAFRCAIAISVAFSCIVGRAGQLECWFVTVIGTIVYELNRQLCFRKFQDTNPLAGDPYGTMYIFTFGGFMGFALQLILGCRQRKPESSTERHYNYTGSTFSAGYALLGTAILAIGLPFLIYSWHVSPETTSPAYTFANPFLLYTPVLCVVFSIAASTLASVGLGLLVKGGLVVRHLVYGPVAGAVIGGASSYYTSNPTYALVVGTAGGLIATIFMLLKQKMVEKGRVGATVSSSLFGALGFIGSAFAVCWKQIIEDNSDGLSYSELTNLNTNQSLLSSDLISYGLICQGMGMGAGVLAGLFIICVNSHKREHHFNDRTYWVAYDGISPDVADGTDYYEEGDEIKNQHAYL